MNTSLIETKPKVRVIKGGAKTDAAEPTDEHFGASTVPIEVATNGVWAGVLNIPPKHISEPHHHGEQAVIVYIISGGFNLIVGEEKEVYLLKAGIWQLFQLELFTVRKIFQRLTPVSL